MRGEMDAEARSKVTVRALKGFLSSVHPLMLHQSTLVVGFEVTITACEDSVSIQDITGRGAWDW